MCQPIFFISRLIYFNVHYLYTILHLDSMQNVAPVYLLMVYIYYFRKFNGLLWKISSLGAEEKISLKPETMG